ncbi:glycosyltransferase family 4 protein [archaeon]|nr:glycosyltransferase family 4 protein [archaeon]
MTDNENKLKVMLLGIPLSWGSGVVTVFLQLANGLRKYNIDVTTITHGWTSDGAPYRISYMQNEMLYEKYYKSMEDLIKNEMHSGKLKPDIIHLHTHTFSDYFNGGMGILLKNTGKPSTIYTVHAIIGYLNLPPEVRKKFFDMSEQEIESIKRNNMSMGQYEIMKLSDRIVTISEEHTKVISRFYKDLENKCITIRNSSDLLEYNNNKNVIYKSSIIRKKISPNNEKIIMFVGRLEENKGAPNIIKAFNLVSKKYPNTKLVIVGGISSKMPDMIKWGLDSQLKNNVHFTGWISSKEELTAYYKSINTSIESGRTNVNGVIVMPVRTKNLFGLAVLEAMSVKAPVITCQNDEGLGFGTTPEPENLARMVDYVFSHPNEVAPNIENTFNIIKEKYSVNNYVRKNIGLYMSLLKNKGKTYDVYGLNISKIDHKEIENTLDKAFEKAMSIKVLNENSIDRIFNEAMKRKIV